MEIRNEIERLRSGLVVSGVWAPVLFTPIIGSPERFAFSIVAVIDGQTHVQRVISRRALRLLYGAKARYINDILEDVEKYIQTLALVTQPQQVDIELPVSGFSVGEFKPAKGTSIEDIIEHGASMSASLVRPHLEDSSEGEIDEEVIATNRWVTEVKKKAVVFDSGLEPFFNREVPVPGHARIKQTFGFHNGFYVANFGVIRASSLGGSFYHLKPRILELMSAKRIGDDDAQTEFEFSARSKELLVKKPKMSASSLSKADREGIHDLVGMVEDLGRDGKIGVRPMNTADDASRRVWKQVRELAA